MKRALIWTLAVAFLVPAAQSADRIWPDELADVQRMVRSTVGDIPYNRVRVRRNGDSIDVSIKLKSVSRQLRTMAREQASVDDVFIGSNINALFKPNIDLSQDYDLTPDADLLDYYFGFGVFNFGRKIKLPASIRVEGANGVEFKNTKKKYVLRNKSIQLRFFERGVSGPGLYALETIVGPWSLVTYFCSSCL